MSPASVEPPSTGSGRRERPGGLTVLAGALLACLTATAPAAELSARPLVPGPLPPAVGATAPNIPLIDGNGKESSLRAVLKDMVVVLVFYIGYT